LITAEPQLIHLRNLEPVVYDRLTVMSTGHDGPIFGFRSQEAEFYIISCCGRALLWLKGREPFWIDSGQCVLGRGRVGGRVDVRISVESDPGAERHV